MNMWQLVSLARPSVRVYIQCLTCGDAGMRIVGRSLFDDATIYLGLGTHGFIALYVGKMYSVLLDVSSCLLGVLPSSADTLYEEHNECAFKFVSCASGAFQS